MSMLNLVPAELRATFCAATHTVPTPADIKSARIASAVAEERLTLDVLQHKLHDVADFATQLALSLPSGGPDLSQLIEDIDACRAEMRLLMGAAK